MTEQAEWNNNEKTSIYIWESSKDFYCQNK